MSSPMIANLEKLLDGPRDGALLRFSLGNAWLKVDAGRAAAYFQDAVERDPAYSAAWKGLGNALTAAGRPQEAIAAWRQGIAVAEGRGDIQAAKEMKVFVRRVEKALDVSGDDASG
jgi:tetratricopeptide (TPR) repeat protein